MRTIYSKGLIQIFTEIKWLLGRVSRKQKNVKHFSRRTLSHGWRSRGQLERRNIAKDGKRGISKKQVKSRLK